MAVPINCYSETVRNAGLTAGELEILNAIGNVFWHFDVSHEVDDKSLDLLRMFKTTEFYQCAPSWERQCGYLEAVIRFSKHLKVI